MPRTTTTARRTVQPQCTARHADHAPCGLRTQITKLTIVPVTLLVNYYHYGVTTNGKVKLALAILLFGVGVATVTDVELRPLGLCYGVVAILTTATYQIWQGTKQREFEMSGTQLQGSIAFCCVRI